MWNEDACIDNDRGFWARLLQSKYRRMVKKARKAVTKFYCRCSPGGYVYIKGSHSWLLVPLLWDWSPKLFAAIQSMAIAHNISILYDCGGLSSTRGWKSSMRSSILSISQTTSSLSVQG